MKSALVAQICAQSWSRRIWEGSACLPPFCRQWVMVSTHTAWHRMQLSIHSCISRVCICVMVAILVLTSLSYRNVSIRSSMASLRRQAEPWMRDVVTVAQPREHQLDVARLSLYDRGRDLRELLVNYLTDDRTRPLHDRVMVPAEHYRTASPALPGARRRYLVSAAPHVTARTLQRSLMIRHRQTRMPATNRASSGSPPAARTRSRVPNSPPLKVIRHKARTSATSRSAPGVPPRGCSTPGQPEVLHLWSRLLRGSGRAQPATTAERVTTGAARTASSISTCSIASSRSPYSQ